MFHDFQPTSAIGLRQQVGDYVRERIRSGALPPGTRLPSTLELADSLGVHVTTMQAALVPLVKEGLLERSPKVGTRVRALPAGLPTRVGIYYSADPLAVPEAGFLQAVHVAISQRLAAEGIALTVYHDPRPEQEQAAGEPLPELRRHARQRAIQGLIVPSCSLPLYAWTSRLPIPVAYATSATIPNRVTHDMRMVANLVCAYLRDAGYDSVGLISLGMPARNEPHPLGADVTLTDCFPIAARAHGLETRPEWIIHPLREDMESGTVEHYGYAAWQRFWRQPNHPRALLAHTDVAARGVLLGLLADGVRVPDELAFVYHQNSGRPLLCPVPAAIIESDTRAFADGLVDQLLAQCRGEQVTPRQAPFRLFPPVPAAPHTVRR